MIGTAGYLKTVSRLYGILDRIHGIAPPLCSEDVLPTLEADMERMLAEQEEQADQIADKEQRISDLEDEAENLRERIKQAQSVLKESDPSGDKVERALDLLEE